MLVLLIGRMFHIQQQSCAILLNLIYTCSIVRYLALVNALFGTFPVRIHVPFIHISYNSITIILVSVSSSCLILVVPMREVSCVRYTPRAWDSRSL